MSSLEKAIARVEAAAIEMAEAIAELKEARSQPDATPNDQHAALAAHNRARRSVA